jgi:peptidoglycan/xylan/chitin deacetylase (PgdA/CDA1 family)
MRRADTRERGEAVVLMYHRVADVEHDPWRLAVTPGNFEQHLAVIRERCRPTSLAKLAAGLEAGSLPPRSVVVTFDDGYRDNLHVAKPLLEQYEIPATVFVVSGYVDSDRDFWWDELAQLSGRTSLPELANDRAARERLRSLPSSQRLDALDALWERAGLTRPPATLVSTGREIASLEETGLIEVGGHTATHAWLPGLTSEEQADEIASGKSALDELLGRPTESFAYPHGEFAPVTPGLVRDLGFRRACAGMRGAVSVDSPLHAIPRVHVEDLSGADFGRLLDRWLLPLATRR